LRGKLLRISLSNTFSLIPSYNLVRLWHQLTIAVLEYVRDPAFSRGDNLLRMYNQFISTIEEKLDPLQLVLICTQISTQLYPTRPFQPNELDSALLFLDENLGGSKRSKIGTTGCIVLDLERTALNIRKASVGAGAAVSDNSSSAAASVSLKNPAEALLDVCKSDLAKAKSSIDNLPPGSEPVILGTYYRVMCEFYKLRGPAHLFYASALLYLGNTPIESLAISMRQALALDVAVAALVGEGLFNFGEVNSQPVITALIGTQHSWIVDLLKTFQSGDVSAFLNIMTSHKDSFLSHPALVAASSAIHEKITLSALVEMSSRRPSADRSISFSDIAKETKVDLNDVERLIIRAKSLGLINASIDEVDKIVNITYVKPRVLDKDQIYQLKQRIDNWREKTISTLNFVEKATLELLA
jgi:26S proteasome regulatory subunit N9